MYRAIVCSLSVLTRWQKQINKTCRSPRPGCTTASSLARAVEGSFLLELVFRSQLTLFVHPFTLYANCLHTFNVYLSNQALFISFCQLVRNVYGMSDCVYLNLSRGECVENVDIITATINGFFR